VVATAPSGAISYDKSTPPSVGCEALVHDLQARIISTYQQQLHGIRYANIFGYLGVLLSLLPFAFSSSLGTNGTPEETENKGDAAIWSAQQILLSMMGITFMETCRYDPIPPSCGYMYAHITPTRFTHKDCDIDKFKALLDTHKPHSAILIAGGGNFNDFYWEDQPARIKMVEMFREFPVRSFPQSIHMTHPDRINGTKVAYGSHPDLQLAARDQPSFKWLEDTFGDNAVGVEKNKVRRILAPDIAFMWGSRPDFRINTKKTYVTPTTPVNQHSTNTPPGMTFSSLRATTGRSLQATALRSRWDPVPSS